MGESIKLDSFKPNVRAFTAIGEVSGLQETKADS